MISRKFIFFVSFFCVFNFAGCGVKGSPQPPLKPPQMGRGKPTFKEAVKDIRPVDVKTQDEKNKEE